MPATPRSFWVGFHLVLLLLLGAELLFARRRANRPPVRDAQSVHRTAVVATVLWIVAALLFSVFLWSRMGHRAATEYLAGYALEESLSIDNLFVFLLLFRLFRIDEPNQPRVLFWGVAGAIVMRATFIAGGIGLLQHFHWVSYLFGVVLLAAAARLLVPERETKRSGPPPWMRWLTRLHPVSLRQDAFFVTENGQRMATMLLLAIVAIELSDIVFALDSIPAVLSVTRQPFLAYSSNIMAVMGLRSLYLLLIHFLTRLRFLHVGLAVVLAFAALKLLAAKWIVVSPLLSLAVILGLLALTVGLSLALPARIAERES